MTEHRSSSNRQPRRQPAPRASEWPELRELRQETGQLRRANLVREPRQPGGPARRANPRRESRPRSVRSGRTRRRHRMLIPAGAVVIALIWILAAGAGSSATFAAPSQGSLAGMSLGQRIVAIARSQVGYRTDPPGSYCNKFSAYWGAGASTCPGGASAEEWCADFAAWAWQHAGVAFTYGFAPGDLNARAASFYEWGVAHGTWHPVASGYHAAPGDVAIYGLNLGSYTTAAHVAIVTGDPRGQDGPDVINGDGDRTGFSTVETGTDQLRADAKRGGGALLAGYVSP